ncbi:helix-turn-helix domain-containing protein [Actinocrispum wychmicini]|uniref:Excisionase family DNA binding protein n=1 Tax=Actinocrispum wychmicini TaxID=1213861 RepID=A0A4R2ISW9_9PSEU|nr:helix-turn-helix domain-containing protein [Actinocrispum wychmicini]TCO47289.1 excisionase family DNA binding protein [Actinocrispum wychmicini]
MTADVPELLTYQQAADQLTMSVRSLRRLVNAGKVPHRRIGHLVRFTTDDLTEILASARIAPLPRSPRRPRH